MEILVKDYRGNIEDLIHMGIISIVDYKGNLLYSVGDSKRVVFARSSAKPMQAISVIESGAYEEYHITDRELSLMCASHSGEEFHVETVREILKKAGLDESYLKCGTHLPVAKYRADEFIKKEITPTEVHSNCSGKHSGMLITCKKMGYSLEDYYLPEHPIQQTIIKNIAEVCGVDAQEVKIGIDGCGVPVHAMPMEKLAYGFARLANPIDLPEGKRNAINKITKAMTEYPEMIGGTDRICTDLMEKFGDRLFAKAGANAFYGIGLKNEGIGIAIKMLDGTENGLPMVIFEVLKRLNVITEEELKDFNPIHLDNNVYNFRKEVVGEREIAFNLEDFKINK